MNPPTAPRSLQEPRPPTLAASAALAAGAPARDPVRVAQVAAKQFFRITAMWGLSAADEQVLLGVGRTTCFALKKGQIKAGLDAATLERVSYVFNIHEALNVIFSSADQASAWVRKPNAAPMFGGRTALERMLSGRTGDLYAVNQYLQGQRGCAFA
jgi:Protein of unknown function (DUF2384)